MIYATLNSNEVKNLEFSFKLLWQERKWLLCGWLFVVIFCWHISAQTDRNFLQMAILGTQLLVVAVLDYRYGLIFNRWNSIILLSGLAFGDNGEPEHIFIAALTGGGILLLLRFISQGGLGWGDIKLMLSMATWLCWEKMLIALLFSFWTGGILGFLLMLFKKYSLRSVIPFGPFLAMGVWISYIFGDAIIIWYEGLLNG